MRAFSSAFCRIMVKSRRNVERFSMYKKTIIFSFYLICGVAACMTKNSDVPTKAGASLESAASVKDCSMVLAVSGMT